MQDQTTLPTDRLDQLADVVAQTRDEVRLQVHLGNQELRDRYRSLERDWIEVQRKREQVAELVDDTAKEVGAGLRLALEELQRGYADLQGALGRSAES